MGVHHATKGAQGAKDVSDVGAGAGSQSRTVDSHIIIRDHEEDDAAVLDADIRSFEPIQPIGLRWEFPRWIPDESLDVEAIKGRRSRGEERQVEKDREAESKLLSVLESPQTVNKLCTLAGMTAGRVQRAIGRLIDQGFAEETTVEINKREFTAYRKTIHAK